MFGFVFTPRARRSIVNRWMKRIAVISLGFLFLLSVAWGLLIWLSERADHSMGVSLPSCGPVSLDESRLQAIEKARAYIRTMMIAGNIPGLAVTVAVDGAIVWSEGFGYADREREIPACPETRFRVGSIANLFTASAMARLYETGLLDLDAPVQKYVPDFPNKDVVITARMLASHRSGIRDYHDDSEAINTKRYDTVTASLEKFRNDPLIFEPDSDFLYSNYGYVLLSAIIEGASGESFLEYMRVEIFRPLRMFLTAEIRPDTRAPRESACYDNDTPFSPDGAVRLSPYNDFSAKWASGGFLSTAEDMVRFGFAHMTPLNHGFLRPQTLDLLFTPRSGLPGFAGSGMAWMTARDLHLRRVHFHFGASSGGTALLAIYPDEKVCVAIAANLGHAKFPYAHLAGVINPFLSDPAMPVLGSLYVGFLAGGFFFLIRFVRKRTSEKRSEPPPQHRPDGQNRLR